MADTPTYHLLITPTAEGGLTVSLVRARTAIDSVMTRPGEHPDIALIEALDTLVQRSSVDRFTLKGALASKGVDKTSSLYKIIRALNAALAAGRMDHTGGR